MDGRVMIFNFNTWNHCREGRITTEDITSNLGHQLIALGHEARWMIGPRDFIPASAGYNVVLESFADNPNTVVDMARAHMEGCRFLIVATEEPTPDGFNSGLEPAMIDRQNAFPDAAEMAEGILYLIPGEGIGKWYGQYGKAAYCELGYAPGSAGSYTDMDPSIPQGIGFYGKMTWRREHMLSELESRLGRPTLLISSLDVPRPDRDAMMRHARLIVQMRANEEWGMISSTRCTSALHLGRPVVAEPHPIDGVWREIVHISPTVEQFYDDVVRLAQDPEAWQHIHAAQLDALRDELPPEHCIGAALRELEIL